MRTWASAERTSARGACAPCSRSSFSAWQVPSPRADAQDLAATKEAVAIPAELGEPIRALLQPDATVVMRGANRLEFWWVKDLPLATAPEGRPSWSNVPDGALVGATTR